MIVAMTETRTTYTISELRQQANGGEALPSAEAAGFPGCEPVRMTAEEFERLDGRIEYWDAQTGVAWTVRDSTVEHERPATRLTVLTHRIAQARGADIACCGTASLHDTGPGGTVRVMEADQIIYLDAERANALRARVQVRDGDGPDIVLEVDHTTDAHRRKVGLYKRWRIPEIWVEVPDAPARSRPRGRRSGLTIHALNKTTKRYRQVAASGVLRGWTAAEIHAALNEPHISQATWAALQRVGRALGEAEGTTPADDPLLRSQLLRSRAEGREEGRMEGRAEAQVRHTRRIVEDRKATVLAILARRGINAPSTFLADLADLAELPEGLLATCPPPRIIEAALACRSAADFLDRMRGGA